MISSLQLLEGLLADVDPEGDPHRAPNEGFNSGCDRMKVSKSARMLSRSVAALRTFERRKENAEIKVTIGQYLYTTGRDSGEDLRSA